MAHNRVEFFTHRADLDGVTNSVALDQSPFGAAIPGGGTIGAEVTFTSSGTTVGYVGIERWLLAWRLSSTSVISTNVNDLHEVRVAQVGTASGVLDSVKAFGGSSFGFQFTPHASGLDWTIRGVYWADDKAGP